MQRAPGQKLQACPGARCSAKSSLFRHVKGHQADDASKRRQISGHAESAAEETCRNSAGRFLVQDWFQGVGLLTFLRDVGKFARVGTMLSRDAVKSRMELDNEGISYTECATKHSSGAFREAHWAPICFVASGCLSSCWARLYFFTRNYMSCCRVPIAPAGSPINCFRDMTMYI